MSLYSPAVSAVIVIDARIPVFCIRVFSVRSIGDLQRHLIRQCHTFAAHDGVLIIRRKSNGLTIMQFCIIFQYICSKVD